MSPRSSNIAIALVALLACWPTAARAQIGRGQISGVVSDVAGIPVAGVTVALDGGSIREVVTAADGRFVITGLDDGAYEIIAAIEGLDAVRRRVQVVDGRAEPVLVTIALQTVEHVVVTADRTEERDVDTVPLAVTVLSSTELAQREAHSVAGFAAMAPSVTFSQNAGFTQLSIRGIGSFQGSPGTDPGSVVYVDGVYLARPSAVLGEFLDVKRVEVLRGPQGTLYGRNAVGGAINIVTNPPADRLELSTRLVGGTLHAVRSETRISGPLIRDRVTATAELVRGFSRGFVADLNHPDNPLGGTDVTAARGATRVLFGARSELLVSVDFERQNGTPLTYAKVLAVKPGYAVDNPPDFHDVRTSTAASGRDLQYGSSARLTWRPTPTVTVTSLSAARWLTHHAVVDTDITELNLTTFSVDEAHRQASQEFIVAGRRSRAAWTAGLFAFGDRSHMPRVVQTIPTNTASHFNPTVEERSSAIFGQATFTLTARVSVVGGVRYSRERKAIENSGFSDPIATAGAPLPGSSYQYLDTMSNTAWTPKLGIDMRIAPAAFVYGSATRGFKSGGFNVSVREPGHAFAPETAWSYEAGLKTVGWRGRARLNVAAFFTDYANLQVQVGVRPGVVDISNAAAATIRGVEMEPEIQLPSGWRTGGHLSWLDARYDKYTALSSTGATFDAAGRRLSNAPEWSARAWIERFIPIGSLAVVSGRADARWQTTVYFSTENDQIQRQRSFAVLDANGTVRLVRRSWSVGVFAKNVLNTDYITGAFAGPLPAFGGQPGAPRQFGVQMNADLAGSR